MPAVSSSTERLPELPAQEFVELPCPLLLLGVGALPIHFLDGDEIVRRDHEHLEGVLEAVPFVTARRDLHESRNIG